MKQRFKKFTIAITGDFSASRGHDKMKQRITRHGGRFASEISSRVTHLVCSKEHYEKGVRMGMEALAQLRSSRQVYTGDMRTLMIPVEQARALKTIKIVSFEWLEDSLMPKTATSRNEDEYLMGSRIEKESAIKTKKNLVRKANIQESLRKFEQSCKDHEKDMIDSGYGLYYDPSDSFPFDITLARANLLYDRNERYRLTVCHPASPQAQARTPPTSSPVSPPPSSPIPVISTPIFPIRPPSTRARARLVSPRAQRLQLFVTHNVPKQYACSVTYSTPSAQTQSHILAPSGSTWELAWGTFSSFFKLKTGKDWALRFAKMSNVQIWEEGKIMKAFVYTPPKEGEPWGLSSGRLGMNRDGRLEKTYDAPYTPLPPMSWLPSLPPPLTQQPLGMHSSPYGETASHKPLLPPPPPGSYTQRSLSMNRKVVGFSCKQGIRHILSEDRKTCIGKCICSCGQRYGTPMDTDFYNTEREDLGPGEVETFLKLSRPIAEKGQEEKIAEFKQEG
ncbi:hypothetical protein N7G274_009100 [Stereocaulon virgatum]|uniref:BRCT domain-containing protein n=1 Tax=Stereocaulon virgatum TaxID=373712 RepID=A0ABR3ZWY3_9LECA